MIPRTALETLRRFLHVEAVSGVVLLLTAAAALWWANSPAAQAYHDLWHHSFALGFGGFSFRQTLHFWINDALMTVFFLVVGMEIRREIHEGSLSDLRQALLPVAAALGGVLAPALIYVALNHEAPRMNGWAVPTATDIAFAVGVLALLGRAIPGNVRIFLLALAIIDDIVAVLIIGLFYSDGLDPLGFGIAAAGVLLVLAMQRMRIGAALAYTVPAVVIWIGMLVAGIHPTLSGVLLGLMTPVLPMGARETEAPVVRVGAALHPWVAYIVMPLFALANAGVSLSGLDLSAGNAHLVLAGVTLALVCGKPLGVVAVSWLMVRAGWCRLPPGVSWGGIVLVGLLAGIGFTMSIFVAMLAFDTESLLAASKLGVLLGSAVAAMLGLGWGLVYARRVPRTSQDNAG
jgi:NhaA family Na+:H+ antiporter